MSDDKRKEGPFVLERERVVHGTLGQVFAFFSDPENLGKLTPPWLRFRVLSCSTPAIEEGTTIDYRLRVRGLPLRWKSLIRSWNPPYEFVDDQLIGPYRSWVHRHTFREVERGVLVGDRVDYSVPGGALVHGLFVRRELKRIFDYRGERLQLLLDGA